VLHLTKNIQIQINCILILAQLILSGCGEGTISDPTGETFQDVQLSSWCEVEPNPVFVDTPYWIHAGNLPKSEWIQMVIENPTGTKKFDIQSDSEGLLNLKYISSATGTGTIGLYWIYYKQYLFLTSCSFEISPQPECGNNLCEETETCTNCIADCGFCPFQCGDGFCMGEESCVNCPEDCNPCPP